jgi:hypothetical protein
MRITLLLLFCCISFLCPAQTGKDNAIYISSDTVEKGWVFVENWTFTPTDDSAYSNKEYADEKWDTLSPVFKTNWKSKGKYKVYPGIGWFRYYFTVDSSMLNKPFALTISHAGASEIYLDGKLLRKTGKIKAEERKVDYSDINASPFIFIIKDSGVHVFAVRYANYDAEKFDKFFDELSVYGIIHDENEWNKLQVICI